MADLVDIPDTSLSAYVPDFAVQFCDFSPASDEDIRGEALLQAALFCFKAAHHEEAEKMLVEMFKRIGLLDDSQESTRWLWIFWVYVAKAVNVEDAVIRNIAKQHIVDKKAGILMTLADRWEARGREQGIVLGEARGRTEGIVLGEARGRTEGRHTLLTRQLTRKFGP